MTFIVRLILNAAALYLVAYLVPGVTVSTPLGALVAAIVLGIVNTILRPILIILSLPLEILTLGLFTFIINAALFWLVGHLGLGLTVTGFWPALLGSLILSIVSFIISRALVPARG